MVRDKWKQNEESLNKGRETLRSFLNFVFLGRHHLSIITHIDLRSECLSSSMIEGYLFFVYITVYYYYFQGQLEFSIYFETFILKLSCFRLTNDEQEMYSKAFCFAKMWTFINFAEEERLK